MTTPRHEIRIVPVTARAVAGVRAEVARGRVAQECTRHLDLVYAAGKAGAVQLDGQNIFIYRAATETTLSAEFCVGVKAPFTAVGPVEPLETPAGFAAMTTLVGPYEGIPEASAAVRAWVLAQGRRYAGPSWEVYGHWSDDPTELRTDIYYLLRE